MVKTRKQAYPPAHKHPAEVDAAWHEKIKAIGSVQARGRIQIWTRKRMERRPF